MKVHRELVGTLPEFRNAVVTIGTFDGVHKGHQQILTQLKEEAQKTDGETVIITFNPHPRKIISSVPGDVKLLTTLSEKITLLENAGIDHLVVIPFDHAFANQSAESYIKSFLYHYFKPKTVIIGYDHRFGKGRVGDYHLLEKYGIELGFKVKEISEELLNEITISSTRIRQSLLNTEVSIANQLLGYPYFFRGVVMEGNKLGRTIGYPTANLHIASEEKLIPGNGVYAVEITFSTELSKANGFGKKKGMMNIGIRPTIDGKKRVIEVHIFDFDEDIYGQTIKISVLHHLRGEVKFDGMDALKKQLHQDKLDAIKIMQ
jgi:riboflavin kinase/FMN adenylyltransferase